jgi:hypothetical protein
MLSERADRPPDRHTIPPGIGARKTTGLAGLDAVLGDLVPGARVCMAGRPCTGKTALLLDAAIRIHRRYATNVIFATAQEFPSEIIERAPLEARPALVEIPALDILRMRTLFPAGLEKRLRPVVPFLGNQGGPITQEILHEQLRLPHEERNQPNSVIGELVVNVPQPFVRSK